VAGSDVTHKKIRSSMDGLILFGQKRENNMISMTVIAVERLLIFREDYLELSLSLPESAPLDRWFL
jgi:hypothetical protein